MDISTKPLEEVIRKLSPDLRAEVLTFIGILLKQVAQNGKAKLRQDWAGMLKADTYTSVELQHLAVDWKWLSKSKVHREIAVSNGSNLSILILVSGNRVTFTPTTMKPTVP